MAIGAVSAATIAFEILLVRTFAVTSFHHFAYLAIGIAMLGFAGGGTAMVLRGPRPPRVAERWTATAAVAATVLLLVVPLASRAVDVDAAQLPWDPRQWMRLALLDTLLALPFFAGSVAVLSGIEMARDRTGSVYGAGFIGSSAGAVSALGLLYLFPPHTAILAPALLAAVGALSVPTPRWARWAGAVLGVAGLGALAFSPPSPAPSPYKDLPRITTFPEARTVGRSIGPSGVATAVTAPALRYAPGLSLSFTDPVPSQTGVFLDGDLVGAVTPPESESAQAALLDWLPSAAPYQVIHGRVLIVGTGGRSEVDNAVAHGAVSVTAVEPAASLLPLVMRAGDVERGIQWIGASSRTVVAETSTPFDLIAYGPTGGPGGGAAGLHALDEDYRNTTEAYLAALRALSANGMLSITRWRATPERGALRVILTAAAALERLPAGDVADAILVVRSWGTVTLLVKPSGFSDIDRSRIAEWSRMRNFDLLAPREMSDDQAIHRDADRAIERLLRSIAEGGSAVSTFTAGYPLVIEPVADARPYPHHHISGRVLLHQIRSGMGQWLPVAEWGYLTACATLIVSAVLGGLLLFGPVLVLRQRPRAPPGPTVVYFVLIGLGFMLAEIALIQYLGLLLGHPTWAVTACLAALLVGSGIGSTISDRFPTPPSAPVLAVAFALAAAAFALLPLVQAMLPYPPVVRWSVGLVGVAALGLPMGQPFPIGLRRIAVGQRRLAWAWAGNGVASVLAAPLAVLIAIDHGANALLGLAAVGYAGAWVVARGVRPSTSTDSLPR